MSFLETNYRVTLEYLYIFQCSPPLRNTYPGCIMCLVIIAIFSSIKFRCCLLAYVLTYMFMYGVHEQVSIPTRDTDFFFTSHTDLLFGITWLLCIV